jgi:hypothetical protein
MRTALQNGLLMFDLRWGAKGHAARRPRATWWSWRASAADGDAGTTLRIFDPWPPNKGARCSVNHAKWSRHTAANICRVFLHA